jgi:hypothetical protein
MARATPRSARGDLSRLARATAFGAYVLALLGLVVAVGYWRHSSHVEDLRQRQRPASDEIATLPGVSATTMRRVGQLKADKRSSFVNFPPAKPPGVIRIGAFGDSSTYGDEVDELSDFPRQLGALLGQDGVIDVEVLNFGSSWHGFHQAYILWDELARLYDLDIILLGPSTFWSDRDTRFNHTNGLSPYFLHARFVVDGDDVHLIEVIGDTYRERFDAYHAFLTPWRYLRYDRNDPRFLAAFLPEGRTLGNPFYYDDRPELDEAIAIDRILLRRMINAGKPIVVGIYPWSGRRELAEAIRELNSVAFCPTALSHPDNFPYQAPLWHSSPAGNAFVARQYEAVLRGRPLPAWVVRTGDPFGAELAAAAVDFDGLDDLQVLLAGREVGIFVDLAAFKAVDGTAVLDGGRTRSLLFVRRPDMAPTDGLILALPNAISETAHLTVGGARAALTPPRPMPGTSAIAVLDLPGLAFDYPSMSYVDAAALEALLGAPVSGEVELQLGERAVLRGSVADGKVVLEPVDARMYWLRAAGTRDVADLPTEGSGLIELELRRGDSRVRVPLARWWVEQVTLDPAAACPDWVPPLP